jgi:hypothetical protein
VIYIEGGKQKQSGILEYDEMLNRTHSEQLKLLKFNRKLIYARLLSVIEAAEKAERANIAGKKTKEIKPFDEWLLCENKQTVVEALRNIMRDKKGRDVAKIVMALEDKRYISIPTKGLGGIIKALEKEFGYIGSKQSINVYYRKKDPKGRLLIPQDEIDRIIDIIP